MAKVVAPRAAGSDNSGGDCWSRLRRTFAADRLDFLLDGQPWKQVYGQAVCSGLRPDHVLALRFVFAAVWLSFSVWSLVDVVQRDLTAKYYMIYLTHWSTWLEASFFVLAFFTTWHAVASAEPDGTGRATPWFVQLTWWLFTFVPTIALVVVVLFWVLLYTPGTTVATLDVVEHGGNAVIIALDMLIFRQPFYFAHVYMPVLVGAIYVLFTYVYYLLGGTDASGQPYIYKVIDWSSPSAAAGLAGPIVILAVPAIYCLAFVIFSQWCCPGVNRPTDEDPSVKERLTHP